MLRCVSGPYNDVDVPAPPSVDSLHLMRRHQTDNRRHLASPEDSGITRSSSDYAVVNKRSSFSPSATKLPEIPHSPSTGSQEGEAPLPAKVTLDPKYQVVKDSIADADSENDPNYESVEEAKARAPRVAAVATSSTATAATSQNARRQHHYEQVSSSSRSSSSTTTTTTTTQQSEAATIRDRVLNSHTYESPAETVRDRVIQRHMYEDITEVNEQKKELSRSGVGDGERERYLYRRKKASEEDNNEVEEEVTML